MFYFIFLCSSLLAVIYGFLYCAPKILIVKYKWNIKLLQIFKFVYSGVLILFIWFVLCPWGYHYFRFIKMEESDVMKLVIENKNCENFSAVNKLKQKDYLFFLEGLNYKPNDKKLIKITLKDGYAINVVVQKKVENVRVILNYEGQDIAYYKIRDEIECM